MVNDGRESRAGRHGPADNVDDAMADAMADAMEDALNDAMLEDLFAAARQSAPMPDRELWERVLADARAHLPAAGPSAGAAPARQSLLERVGAALRGAFGGSLEGTMRGWGMFTGLATATIAGLWIGYAHPSILHRIGPMGPMGPKGPMAGISWEADPADPAAVTGFELEDFEPGLGDISALLEEG